MEGFLEKRKELDKEELRRKIIEKFAALTPKPNYFELLELNKDAGQDEIREAYFFYAKLLHPDTIAKNGLPELANEATAVFKTITHGYHILSDKLKRIKYLEDSGAFLKQGAEPPKKGKEEEAKIFFHKGQILMQRRSYTEAESCFRNSINLDPKQSHYFNHLGLSILHNLEIPETARLEKSKECFEKALEIGHNSPEPYYYLSLYYKSIGDAGKQKAFLQDALTINPGYVDAQREMRLITIRRKQIKGSGFMQKVKSLLKKK